MRNWILILFVLSLLASPLYGQDEEQDNDNNEQQEEVQAEPTFLDRIMFWRRDSNRGERNRNPYAEYNQLELDRALWNAISERDRSKLTDLLREGASANSRNSQQRTALIEASRVGYLDGVKVLINYGASVNAKDMYGGTPYIYASRGGHSDIVYLLISNGARPEGT